MRRIHLQQRRLRPRLEPLLLVYTRNQYFRHFYVYTDSSIDILPLHKVSVSNPKQLCPNLVHEKIAFPGAQALFVQPALNQPSYGPQSSRTKRIPRCIS